MGINIIALRNHPDPKQLIKKSINDSVISATGSKRHSNASLKDFNTKVQNQVKDALLKNQGVFVHGPTGTGKTHLLTAILREIIENRYRKNLIQLRYTEDGPSKYLKGNCFMTTAHDLNNEIKNIYNSDSYTLHQLIYDYTKGTPHLFIDDLGTEKQTEHTEDTWDAIINRRWCFDNLSALYLSSNNSLDLVGQRYGARIFSRLKDMCAVIEMVGVDKRGR